MEKSKAKKGLPVFIGVAAVWMVLISAPASPAALS